MSHKMLKKVVLASLLALLSAIAPVYASGSVSVCQYTVSVTITANMDLVSLWSGMQFAPGTYYSEDGITISGQSTGTTYTDDATMGILNGNPATDDTVIWASTAPAGQVFAVFKDAVPFPVFADEGTDFTVTTPLDLVVGTCSIIALPVTPVPIIGQTTVTVNTPEPPKPGINTGKAPILIVNEGESDPITQHYDLAVWDYDPVAGQGFKAVSATVEEIDAFIAKGLPQDTPLATSSNGLINVYVLKNGNLQVNWGPDGSGNVNVVIFTRGIRFVESYSFNVKDFLK